MCGAADAFVLEDADRKAAQAEAGCFVLLAKLPSHGPLALSPRQILQAYKEQYGVEQNFGFLKDPAIFLKKEERIEALGLILLLALLITRLAERDLAQYTQTHGPLLTGWDKKKTQRPTLFMLMTKFPRVLVVKIGERRQFGNPLKAEQREWLQALNLDDRIFLAPSRSP